MVGSVIAPRHGDPDAAAWRVHQVHREIAELELRRHREFLVFALCFHDGEEPLDLLLAFEHVVHCDVSVNLRRRGLEAAWTLTRCQRILIISSYTRHRVWA
jgi:hypothetical protein